MLSRKLFQGPVASARLLVLILLAVVASFLVSTGLSEHRQSAIDRGVDEIVTNEMRVRELRDRVRVEVEDTGPGIPLGARENIFKPFVRLPSDQPGIGLGLATVKRIVEATVGVGSCFWFELPA